MKAVILAGGLGTRLKPFTQVIPKPLLPIGEKSILEIQIEKLKQHGFDEIFLATNYKSEYIENFFGNGEKYGVKLQISKEEKPLGTVGPVTLLKEQLNEPFVVMNGDILSQINFADFYKFAMEKKSALTITIKKEILPFAFGNVFFEDDLVTGVEEKPDLITYVLAGIYVMTPDIFKYIPDDTYFGMDTLIKNMLDKNLPVVKYDLKEYWLDIGRPSDYEKARTDFDNVFKGE
ncbi:MAG: mannose-1-phosphate guanyltransferase [Calditrichaeota bacterium]|nr:MAG: mannose-1-phosphate guanyltransferase [Calditrichota bacterium]MBL1204608.1 mannose-1-phosphate guanyltransferase [Calditrichota bacterium]NOG44437.1 NTP transferase domain-containing protein [Calditrichota bacterium]